MSYPDDQTILKCVLQLDKKWRENIYIWMRIMMEFFIQKTTSELLSKQHISQATIIKAFLQIQRRRSVYESFLKNKIAGLFGKAQFPQSFWRIATLLKKDFDTGAFLWIRGNTSGAAASAKSIVSCYSLVFYATKLIKNKGSK